MIYTSMPEKIIVYILRKTIYRNFDHETQDMLLILNGLYNLIQILFAILLPLTLYTATFPILDFYESKNPYFFSPFKKVYILISLLFICIFRKKIFETFNSLAQKIHFTLLTQFGYALSKEDFKEIKKINPKLYTIISKRECKDNSFKVCFELCKSLKKGGLEFIVIKNLEFYKNPNKEMLKIHVLYINGEWAFDPYSSSQFPIEKIHAIYKGKVYKVFTFDEISSKSFDEFKEEQKSNMINGLLLSIIFSKF